MTFSKHSYYAKKPSEISKLDGNLISSILNKGHYPIISLGHISFILNIDYFYLRRLVVRDFSREKFYDNFSLQKRNGSLRLICAPSPHLLMIQRWILDNLLVSLDDSAHSFAYATGKGTYEAAAVHCNAKWIVKLDLKDFFQSIDEIKVYKLFRNMGYTALLAFELARICTYSVTEISTVEMENNSNLYPYTRQRPLGTLPQGAPTSGKIANQIAISLDEDLMELSSMVGASYTRYADDLVFSFSSIYSRAAANKLISLVTKICHSNGFTLNTSKIVVIKPGGRKEVLGYLVDSDKPRLPKSYIKYVDNIIYACEKYGVSNFYSRTGFNSLDSFINHVTGKIAYLKVSDPQKYYFYKERWELLSNSATQYLPVPPH